MKLAGCCVPALRPDGGTLSACLLTVLLFQAGLVNSEEPVSQVPDYRPIAVRNLNPQMRILVAMEAVDGRKGIDSLARLRQEKLAADPFSGWPSTVISVGVRRIAECAAPASGTRGT